MKILKLKKSYQMFLISALTIFGLFGGTVVTPLSVALAAPCTGFNCDHMSMYEGDDCGTVSTKRTTYITIPWGTGTKNVGRVELRYSAECDTAWTRTTIVDTYAVSADPYTSVVTVTRKYYAGGGQEYYTSDTRTDYGLTYLDQNWSRMLYIPYSSSDTFEIKACGYLIREVNGDRTATFCTSYWTGV